MSSAPPVHPIEADAWKSTFNTPSVVQAQLSQTLEKCKTSLTDLDDEEKSLEARLKEISQAKTDLKARVDKLEAAIAPHRKLPPELLSRIFELSRGEELRLPRDIPEMLALNPRQAHLKLHHECRLEHVCSFWRQVAQQTPLLVRDVWPVVKVNFFEVERQFNDDFRSLIYSFARSSRDIIARGTHTVHIDFAGEWLTGMDEHMEDLWIPDNELLDQTLEEGSPHIKKIIVRNDNISQAFLDRSVELFASFPRLRSITLEFDIEEGGIGGFPLHRTPLYNLTDLTVLPTGSELGKSVISTDGFYQILRSLPKLRTCLVQMTCSGCFPAAYEPARDNLVHTSLESLTIYREHCECLGSPPSCDRALAPIQLLALPSLLKIEISTLQFLRRRHARILVEFIIRSKCQLRICSLEANWDSFVDFIPLKGSEWEALVPCFTNLTTLNIKTLILPPGASREISEGRYLPRLSSLSCQIPESEYYYEPMLRECLKFRPPPDGEDKQRQFRVYAIPEDIYQELTTLAPTA